MRLSIVLLFSFLLSGCAVTKQWVEFYNPPLRSTPDYQSMTYMQILNKEMKEKCAKRPRKRMMVLYGKFKVTEQAAGIKFTFPF